MYVYPQIFFAANSYNGQATGCRLAYGPGYGCT